MTRPMACWVYRSGETVALATWGSITELAPFVKWREHGWFVEDSVRTGHLGERSSGRGEGSERNLPPVSLCSLLVGKHWVGRRCGSIGVLEDVRGWKSML